jgi:phosphonate transport system substrate-binding protein
MSRKTSGKSGKSNQWSVDNIMKCAHLRLPRFFVLSCLCLAILMSTTHLRLSAADEYPTIQQLMDSGKLDKELADDPPLPESYESYEDEVPNYPSYEDIPTTLPDEDQEPVTVSDTETETQEQAPLPPIEMAKKVVLIGRVPFMNTKAMMAHYQGLISFLRKELGAKDVQIVIGKDYAGVLNALSRGTIDFAWLGPMAYVIGEEKMSLFPLVQAKRRSGATYRGVFITRSDSRILGIEDIKNKVIGFVDPESASGYLYPLYFLHRSKINPHRDCRKVEFLKMHDAVLEAVLNRKIDVGVCLEDTLLAVKDKKILDQLLVLGKTYEVPSDVVACRADCHPTLRDKVQEAFLKTRSLKQTVNLATGLPPVLEFLPVNNTHLNTVRGVLKAIKSVRKP